MKSKLGVCVKWDPSMHATRFALDSYVWSQDHAVADRSQCYDAYIYLFSSQSSSYLLVCPTLHASKTFSHNKQLWLVINCFLSASTSLQDNIRASGAYGVNKVNVWYPLWRLMIEVSVLVWITVCILWAQTETRTHHYLLVISLTQNGRVKYSKRASVPMDKVWLWLLCQ